jgi:thiol-disulfide isomerase/thioredoxin
MSSLSLGIFTIKTSQLLVAICLLAAFSAALIASWRRKVKVTDTSIHIVLISFVIARATFVGIWFDQYWKSPLSILDIRDGGFNVAAGIVAGCILAIWHGWRQPPLRTPLTAGALIFLLTWGFAAPSSGLVAGEIALPSSTVTTFTGQVTTLRELADGKPLVVNLWASWCPPCRREMPLLVESQRQHKDVAFVFVNEDSNLDEALLFANQMQVPADRIVADAGYTLLTTFHAGGLPTTLYYAADGKLMATHVGGLSQATFASELQKLKK